MIISSEHGRSLFSYMHPVRFVASLWRCRELLIQFSKREISSRYKGSVLGIFWAFAQPIMMLAIYTFVFGVIFRSRWPRSGGDGGIMSYALVIFCGIACFNLINECVGRAPSLIKDNINLVKKVIFPLETLPLSVLGASLYHGAIIFLILAAANAVVNFSFHYTIIALPLILLPMVFMIMGLSWLVAGLGVVMTDMQPMITLFNTVWFFLTPVFYSIDSIPAAIKPFMMLNPMAFIVDSVRRVILWGEWPQWHLLGIWLLVSFFMMLAGYALFMWGKENFADLV